MTKKLKSIGLLLVAMALLTGCALTRGDSTTEQKANDIRNLTYAAASIGTQVAITEHPEWQPRFEIAYNDLNQLVEGKVVTGLLLRQILDNLPVDELKSRSARIAIDGATMLYDASVGDRVNIENQPYVVAAATGIRDGMKTALGK